MSSVILTCSCSRVPQRAKDAFELLFHGVPLPQMYSNRDARKKYVEALPEGEAKRYLANIAEKKGKKFAYYFDLTEQGTKIKTAYNLLTGAKLL